MKSFIIIVLLTITLIEGKYLKNVCSCNGWNECIVRSYKSHAKQRVECQTLCEEATDTEEVRCVKESYKSLMSTITELEACYVRKIGSPFPGCSTNGERGQKYESQRDGETGETYYKEHLRRKDKYVGRAADYKQVNDGLQALISGTGLAEFRTCIAQCLTPRHKYDAYNDNAPLAKVDGPEIECGVQMGCSPSYVNLTKTYKADEECSVTNKVEVELHLLDHVCACAGKTAECSSLREQLSKLLIRDKDIKIEQR